MKNSSNAYSVYQNNVKKLTPPSLSWNSIPCFCDGVKYKSLFSLSIDFEITYCWIIKKLRKTNGAPVTISGHTIVLESWLAEHPEYQFPEKQPAGGINTGKEANK